MLVVAAGALGLCFVFYYRAFGLLKRRQWGTLLALRGVAVLIVILLLFRPVFTYYKDTEEKASVVFLVDTSSSMSISDDATGRPRYDRARDRVQAWWEKLQNDFNLHLIAFSERAVRLDDVRMLSGTLADGKATSLSRALVAASRQVPKKNLEAVVMLSDGVHNSARSPLEVARKIGVPVHTVGVGASLKSDITYRDIQLTGLDCPDRLLVNNKARIRASVEGIGLAGRVTRVILKEDDRIVEEKELTLDEVEGPQEVEFEFRPTKTGRHTYTVTVEPAAEEKITENNERCAVAIVVEAGMRVLYIEGTLRAEYGALVDRFLSKDPDLEFCALVQTRPNFFLRRTNIEGLSFEAIPTTQEEIDQFNVFIIGDLDSTYLKPEVQALLEKRIREGAGLVMLGGYHGLGPGGYAETPISRILPVTLGSREVGQVTDPFLPELTPEGVRHPIFANIAEFFPTQNGPAKTAGLPPLDGCTRVEGTLPTASVLATCPMTENQMPVLAVHSVDRGRTAVFCGDTTRGWQQGPRALGQDSPFLRFWGQMVRWLAGRQGEVETTAGISGATDKGYYEPEETVTLSAIVRDEKGEGATGAAVVAKVRGPAGRVEEVKLTAIPGPGGHYQASYEPKEPGTYEIVMDAKVGELTVSTPPINCEVGRPHLEFEKLDLDEKMLSEIASASGGRYIHITTADHLIEQLDRSVRKDRIYLERRLYWPPLFWVIFVAALSAEWLLRRRFQLR